MGPFAADAKVTSTARAAPRAHALKLKMQFVRAQTLRIHHSLPHTAGKARLTLNDPCTVRLTQTTAVCTVTEVVVYVRHIH